MDSDQTPRWNILGEDDADDSQEVSPAQSRSLRPHIPEGVLFQNLESQEETDEDEDDDTESQTQKKKKRFTTLLKSVFPSIVERDLKRPKTPSEEYPIPPYETTSAPQESVSLSSEEFDDAPIIVADAEDLPVEVAQSTPEPQTSNNTVQGAQDVSRSDMPRETLVSPAGLSLDQQAIHYQESAISRASRPVKDPDNNQIIHPKQPSFAEKFYNRRRERKLARKIKKQERLTREIKRSQTDQLKQQERLNQRQAREITQAKQEAERQNHPEPSNAYAPATKIETILKDPKYHKQPEMPPVRREKPITYVPNKSVEPTVTQPKIPEISKPERTYIVEPEKTSDQPKQPKFESSFDAKYIKPLENRVSQLENETKKRIKSISPIVSGKLHRTPHRPKSTVYGMDAAPPTPPQSQLRASGAKQQPRVDIGPMYKQSIQYGFVGALCIVIIGVLAYTLR